MKKKLALLMVGIMTVAMMVGCGNSAASSSTVESSVEPAASSEASVESSEETVAVDPDVQKIIDRGELRVGVKNAVPGFGLQDTLTNTYTGLEIDIANKIAEYLGVTVEFTPVTAATRTELLDAGDIDCVLATFTITEERKQSWDFTTPYFTDAVTVLVEDATGIQHLEDLVDTKVGVSSGSTSARALTAAMIEAGLISGDNFDKDTFDAATWTEGIFGNTLFEGYLHVFNVFIKQYLNVYKQLMLVTAQ